MRNDTDARGLRSLIKYYAELQAEIITSARASLITSRASFIIQASKDREYKSAKDFISSLEDGNLEVIRASFLDDSVSIFNNTSHPDFVGLINLDNYFKAELCELLNLSRNNIRKSQYINESEVELQKSDNLNIIQDMLIQRQRGAEKINLLYGTDIKVSLREDIEDELYEEFEEKEDTEEVEEVEEKENTEEVEEKEEVEEVEEVEEKEDAEETEIQDESEVETKGELIDSEEKIQEEQQ